MTFLIIILLLEYSTAKEILKELNAIKSNVFGFSEIIFMQSLIRRIILFVPQQKFFTNKDEEQESSKDLKSRNSRRPPPHSYPDDTKNCCDESATAQEVWEKQSWGADTTSWESFLNVLIHASSSVLDVLITQEPSLLSVFVKDTTDLLEDALNVVDLELSNNIINVLTPQTQLSVTNEKVLSVRTYQKFCDRCKSDDIVLEIPTIGVLSQIIVFLFFYINK